MRRPVVHSVHAQETMRSALQGEGGDISIETYSLLKRKKDGTVWGTEVAGLQIGTGLIKAHLSNLLFLWARDISPFNCPIFKIR